MGGYVTTASFFFISLAFKLAWTAISSLLSQFSREYGPEVLLHLNICYFFPSIPVLVVQTLFNDVMDRRFGLPLAALLRFTVGLGGLALLMSYFTVLASSHAGLLITTVFVGMSYGLAFGTSYQLASKFSSGCTVALTLGFVSCGPVVLVLDVLLKDGPFYSPEGLARLFSWVAVITASSLLAACWVVLANFRTLRQQAPGQQVELRLPGGKSWGGSEPAAPKRRSDARVAELQGHHTALDMMESGNHAGLPEAPTAAGLHRAPSAKPGKQYDDHDDKQYKRDLPLWTLAWRVSPAALSIFLSVGTSMIIFPFFTYVRSTGLLGDRLAEVLFYVRLVGDILGRVVPRRLQVSTAPRLLLWGLAKTTMVPLLFLSIFRPQLCLGDVGAVLLVGAFWVLSGYLNTCSYLLAPQLVPPTQKARASGIMTVAFQSSCFVALMIAGGIQRAVI